MTYPISCVLLIPADHREAINELAESLGYGPGNLSVPLYGAGGDEWFGCHTWCSQEFIDQLSSNQYQGDAMGALVVSVHVGGDSDWNWSQALLDNGLEVIHEEV